MVPYDLSVEVVSSESSVKSPSVFKVTQLEIAFFTCTVPLFAACACKDVGATDVNIIPARKAAVTCFHFPNFFLLIIPPVLYIIYVYLKNWHKNAITCLSAEFTSYLRDLLYFFQNFDNFSSNSFFACS